MMMMLYPEHMMKSTGNSMTRLALFIDQGSMHPVNRTKGWALIPYLET